MSNEKKHLRRLPRAATQDRDAGYPTLQDFGADFSTGRRAFLKHLGSVAVGAGIAVGAGAALWPHQAAAEGEHPTAPTSEPMPLGGSPPVPAYEHVTIPASGTTSAYLAHDSYLTYALSFVTYDHALAAFYRLDEASALKVASDVLRTHTCEDVQGQALATLQESIRTALMKHYEAASAHAAPIESLTLIVHHCDDAALVDGDMPSPDYP